MSEKPENRPEDIIEIKPRKPTIQRQMITSKVIDNTGFAKSLPLLPKLNEPGAYLRMTKTQREAYEAIQSKSAFQKRNEVNMSVIS